MPAKSLCFVISSVFLLSTAAIGTSPSPADVELAYDDGESEGAVVLGAGAIAAVRMSPDSGTWTLKTARYYFYQGEGKVCVFADNQGEPGADLLTRFTVASDTVGWYDVDLSAYNITLTGDFYVGIEGVDPYGNSSIGHDFLAGGNGRAWNYYPDFDWENRTDITYFIRAVVTGAPGVEEEPESVTIAHVHSAPNPFTNSTTISYTLSQTSCVSIEVWNVTGRRIRSLVDEVQSPGNHSVEWKGTGDEGIPLLAGVYFLTIGTESTRLTRKLTLVR